MASDESNPQPDANAPDRVLIIRPSALGDVCRTVPVLASLKKAWPQARIDWLVQDSFADAVRAHPDLHRVVPFERARLARWYTPVGLRDSWQYLRRLAHGEYDLVIDCQGLARSGLFSWATRARQRVGPRDARELGWLGYNQRVQVDAILKSRGIQSEHTVERMLALVASLGIAVHRDMRLFAPPEDLRAIDSDPRLSGLRYAVLAPTSRWPGKRWPAARFAKLAEFLLERAGFEVLCIVGSAGERKQCEELTWLAQRDGRVLDLMGKTSVGRLMALIARSSLVVANDSAALHMAVGFGRPLVALYGPTDVAKVGPFGRETEVAQHVIPGETLDHKDERAGQELMKRISVEEVAARAYGQLLKL